MSASLTSYARDDIADPSVPRSLARTDVDHRRAMGGTLRRRAIRDAFRAAFDQILDDTGLPGVDHVVLSCPNTAVIKRVATLVKGLKSVVTSPIGFAGASDAAIAAVQRAGYR